MKIISGTFLQINNLDGSNQLKRAGRLVHKQTVLLSHEPVDLGKWNRFYLDLEKLIQPDPGSIYRVEISFRKSYSLYYCEGEQKEKLESVDPQAEARGNGTGNLILGFLSGLLLRIL